MKVRVLTAADADAFAREMARALAAGDMLASADPAGTFVMKSFGVHPSLFAGAFEADELVGFVSAELKIAVVRPDRRRRGIGRSLVEAGLGLAADRHYPDLLLGAVPGDAIAPAFLGATGFAYHSTVWDLDLPPDREVTPPSWPDGVIGRPFDRDRDVEPWVQVFNAAFAEHPTPLQLSADFVQAGLSDQDNQDGDIIIAEEVATGALLGTCCTDPTRRDGRVGEHGEVWAVGVRPDRQGRGLGRQLLRAGVGRLRAVGVPQVSLSVNGRNESALGLYESEGFVRVRTRDRWSRPVAAEATT